MQNHRRKADLHRKERLTRRYVGPSNFSHKLMLMKWKLGQLIRKIRRFTTLLRRFSKAYTEVITCPVQLIR